MTQANWQQHLLETSDTGYLVHDGLRVAYANARARALLRDMLRGDAIVADSSLARRVTAGSGDANRSRLPLANGELLELHSYVLDDGLRCCEISAAPAGDAELALQLLAETTAATAGTQTQNEALRVALGVIAARMGWSLGEFWMPAEDGLLARCCYWHAADCEAVAAFEPWQKEPPVSLSPAARERLIGHGAPLVLDDGYDGDDLFRVARMTAAGLGRACALPIRRGDTVVAILVFFATGGADPSAVRLDTVATALAPLCGHIERLHIESELAAKDRHLALLMRDTETATFELDIASNVIRWDKALSRIFGFPEDRTSLDFADVSARFHRDDVDEVLGAVDDSVRSCGLLQIKHRIQRPDGETRWLFVRGVTVCDAEGAPQRIVGICWDETASQQDSERLKMLARFHEEYPEPVFRLSRDGEICDGNAAAQPFLEDLGIGCEADLPGPLGALVDDVRRSGSKLSSNVRLGDRIFHVTLIPAAGTEYINVYATDVTRLHRSQEAMQQATKMEAIGQLAGGVAHDFNNRLTVILGNLELLEDSCQGEDLTLLREARQAAENSSVLARKLLSISRPQQVDYRPTEINAVVRNLASLLGRCLGVDMELSLVLNPVPLEALLDSTELEDVLLNLTLNARDAMAAEGQLTIESDTVNLAEEDLVGKPGLAPGEHVVISVSDTGHGMPARVRTHAFEPFFTTKDKQGTGLGLSTVYTLVRKWRGHVSIYSEEGVGTCIRIYVPKSDAAASAEPVLAHTHTSLRAFTGGDDPLVGLRVLLVEDDDAIRHRATHALASLGCAVTPAVDAVAAERILRSAQPVDALLTDLVLPGEGDGLALAGKALALRPGLHVLISSGYTQAALERDQRYRDAMTAGWPFVAKPYSSVNLGLALRQAVTPVGDGPGRAGEDVRRAG